MVSIPPARELTDLEAIALLSGLAAGATALPNESLNQELVAPDSSASLGGIKRRETYASASALSMPSRTAGSGLDDDLDDRSSGASVLIREISVVSVFEGAFQPP